MPSLLGTGVRRSAACGVIAVCCALAACGSSPSGPSPSRISVTAITPSQGTTLGGTAVTISGVNFSAGATVTLGGAPAASAQVVDATTIKAVTGVHIAGTVDVTVVIGADRATLPSAFTYVIPQPSTNAPPVISSIVARGSRTNEPAQFADVDEEIAVTATVTDDVTPVSSLTFDWSSDVGTFTGTGASVRWRSPHTAGLATLKLTVTEKYTDVDSQGLPVQKQNQVQQTSLVDVHDSIGEIGRMSRQFLLDFSDSSIRDASYVVRDFMMGCGIGGTGKENEQKDVQENRDTFWIDKSDVSTSPRVDVDFGSSRIIFADRLRFADAYAAVDVAWTSHCIAVNTSKGCTYVGRSSTVQGTDWVTAHYDPPTKRWWLCDSDFEQIAGTLKIMQ